MNVQEEINEALSKLQEISLTLIKIKRQYSEFETTTSPEFERLFLTPKQSTDVAVPTVASKLNIKKEKSLFLKFSKKEIEKMSTYFQNIFAFNNELVKIYYKKNKNLYVAKFKQKELYIEVSSKDISKVKMKFYEKMKKIDFEMKLQKEKTASLAPSANTIFFNDCASRWLDTKKRTTKKTTWREYERLLSQDIYPFFKNKYLAEISRQDIQDFLFSYVDREKLRTAEKIQLIIRCVFDIASEDYSFTNPTKNIELPFRLRKKGKALTKDEEKTLVDFCVLNSHRPFSSAYLILLYFGLRKSELPSIEVKGESLTCITSKTRFGRDDVRRVIPFTPVFKRVLPHVDFVSAKKSNLNTISNSLKKILPNHHVHELRYTFITRCKECGVNGELVMKWDGHEYDSDVRTSKVDRGYTDFSHDFELREAEKVDYHY